MEFAKIALNRRRLRHLRRSRIISPMETETANLTPIHVDQTITLVDGTLVSALPSLMEASVLKAEKGSGKIKWRLHTHCEVAKNWPVRMDLTPNGGGDNDERAMLAKVLEADRLYVMDRGYAKFALFNQIVSSKSSYVCRLRDNSVWEVDECRLRKAYGNTWRGQRWHLANRDQFAGRTRGNHRLDIFAPLGD